jgi:aryl-alcohol dehydrogenase-like predicted oxidoreductase
MPDPISNIPELMLGTAMWGWTIDPKECFALMDCFYESGNRKVDAATNYPIDKNKEHFRLAENILLEWIKAHQVTDLQVNMKIGSLNNLKSPEHNLSKSFLMMNMGDYLQRFQSNLYGLMVHWDNREEKTAIGKTLEALDLFRKNGLAPGLSGIKNPQIYAELNQSYKLDFDIQIKHNLLHSDYQRYADFHKKRRFYTYGINAGGIKLDQKAYRENSSLQARSGQIQIPADLIPNLLQIKKEANKNKSRLPLSTMNHFGMIFAYYQPDVKGILLGTSQIDQLKSSLEFYGILSEAEYSDVWGCVKSNLASFRSQ